MTASYKWRVRDDYFKGAGSYSFEHETSNGTKKLTVDVDKNGHFKTEMSPAEMPIGIYAKFAGRQ